MEVLREYWRIVKKSFSSWRSDNAILLSAALSYYTLFSLAPILLIIVLIAGRILGEQTVQSEIISQVQHTFGKESAQTVAGMIQRIYRPGEGYFTTTISILVLFFTSTNLFKNLKKILNIIWGVRSHSRSWVYKQIIDRLVSFGVVLIFGLLVLITLIIDTGLVAFGETLKHFLPGFAFFYLWEVVNFLFSVLFMSVIFAIVFKVLPDTKIPWCDVIFGSALTALLFSIGKWLIGLYLGRSSIGTVFGGASSLIVILIWIYYSAQIMFFGAEVTHNYAYHLGSRKEKE
jgi:membrane protein